MREVVQLKSQARWLFNEPFNWVLISILKPPTDPILQRIFKKMIYATLEFELPDLFIMNKKSL